MTFEDISLVLFFTFLIAVKIAFWWIVGKAIGHCIDQYYAGKRKREELYLQSLHDKIESLIKTYAKEIGK